MGRPIAGLTITDVERGELKSRLRTRKGPADEKLRIRIILGCADGFSGKAIAESLGISMQTVSKWRRRYALYRMDGLIDAPRPAVIVNKVVRNFMPRAASAIWLDRPLFPG